MGIWSGIKKIKEGVEARDDAHAQTEAEIGNDQTNTPGTRHGEKRGEACYKIDPVTKQPNCDDDE